GAQAARRPERRVCLWLIGVFVEIGIQETLGIMDAKRANGASRLRKRLQKIVVIERYRRHSRYAPAEGAVVGNGLALVCCAPSENCAGMSVLSSSPAIASTSVSFFSRCNGHCPDVVLSCGPINCWIVRRVLSDLMMVYSSRKCCGIALVICCQPLSVQP